ncbi:hypothetical protein D8770_27915 [Methylobacterium sp. DB1607]|nr:hypothetical protein [Methylobacterium sp. DB1607]
MRANPSRRAVVRAFSVAPIAAVSSASALSRAGVEHQPDADLLALGVCFDAAEAAYRAACRRADEIEAAIVLPEKPDAIYVAEGDRALGLEAYAKERHDGRRWYIVPPAYSPRHGLRRAHFRYVDVPATPLDRLPEHSVIARRVPWPEAQARADEIVAAYDGWVAERDRIDVESGLAAANEAADALGEQLSDIEAEIEDAIARTLGGLRVKARMARRDLNVGQQINEALHESLIRDLLAMGDAACA